MKVNGFNSSGFLEQIKRNKKNDSHGFESSFAGNLAESSVNREIDTRNKAGEIRKENDIRYAAMANGINNVCNVQAFEKNGVRPCDVKNITYEESDNVKACIEGGYVLKAKMCENGETVYVERKDDDGKTEAFEVDINSVDKDTEMPIEKMALETYNKSGNGKNDSIEEDLHEALLKFSEYVKDRIENGPPKFSIGSMEMSIEDWDNLIKKVDEIMDEVKEELRERVAKQEQEEEKQVSEDERIKKLLEDGGITNGY